MNQLRRKFANLWNPAQREDIVRDQQQQNGHNRRSSSSTSSSEVPAALELDATDPASPVGASRRQQRRHGGYDQDGRQKGNEEEEDEAPPRLLSLSHPWGTSDPRPPPGWTSSASRPASQRREHSSSSSSSRSNLRARRRNDGIIGRDDENLSDGDGASWREVADLGFPATAAVAPGSSSSPSGMTAGARNSGRRRGRDGDEDNELDYRSGSSIGYRGGVSATKRYRAEDAPRSNGADRDRKNGETAEGSDRRQEQLQKPSRRRRTCPADSTFVSPSAKRVIGNDGTSNALADEEELEHLRRSAIPSRLAFSAGFFKVLRGSKAAAKRARSATKLKRKTRELQAAVVVRQAFLSAHAEEQERGGEGGEEQKEEGVPRRGDSRSLSLRGEDEDEIWRRINLEEAELGREAEEKAAARVRRLRNLRADALVAFGQAQEARDELVSTAKTALGAVGGADMATLRSLFASVGGRNNGSKNRSSRFKDDAEVSALLKKYAALEAILENIKAVKTTGDVAALEAVLFSQEAKNVQNQPEFLSASGHLRKAKEEAEKSRAKQEAHAAREAAAAAAAAEAAKAQREKNKASDLASNLAQAAETERSKAAAAAAAAAASAADIAAQQAEQDKAAAAAEEERELAEAAQAAAGGAAAADQGQFAERAKVLKAAVESRRAGVDEIFASSDPGVKKIRMAFKKSYQGCLNKLSATPSTVQQVTRDIKLKAEAPLLDARRAGWEAKAQEFLYFNLADKLVDYSERDHFSGDSYRMAFPLASVAVDLMAEHDGLSDLFLGTLYSRCPSAIPALSFDTAGMSDEEVMASLGQMGGEDLPAFLNRTKGLVVLMAAVMQTPPHGGATASHPLPLSQGWCWLARFVNGLAAYVKTGNAPPVPTGPVLEWFLKVAGFELQRRYGRAFDKVVQTIRVEVLPILLPKSIVPHLLDVVLEDYEGRGRRFLPPAGRDKEFRHFRAWGDT